MGKDEIQFKTDRSRHDLYESVLGYVKSLGFRTQPLRDSKPEFKIPKESILFGGKPRNRQISIRILPKSGREYLQTGWENLLILDLKRSRKYGSDHHNTKTLNVKNAILSKDKKEVFLSIIDLKTTNVMEIRFQFLDDNGKIVKGLIQNTINQIGQ